MFVEICPDCIDDCFVDWHGIKNQDGRCLCCGFILPNSYEIRRSHE